MSEPPQEPAVTPVSPDGPGDDPPAVTRAVGVDTARYVDSRAPETTPRSSSVGAFAPMPVTRTHGSPTDSRPDPPSRPRSPTSATAS